jgi:hypothetical protein
MAVVHVQCPQRQSIEVVKYGKQANGTNAIGARTGPVPGVSFC